MLYYAIGVYNQDGFTEHAMPKYVYILKTKSHVILANSKTLHSYNSDMYTTEIGTQGSPQCL